MSTLQSAAITVTLAARRIATRWLYAVLVVLALALAGAVVGAGSLVWANAFEHSVQQRLAATPPSGRALVVSEYVPAPSPSASGPPPGARELARFAPYTGPLRTATIYDPVGPEDAFGIHLATLTGPGGGGVLSAGRRPGGCRGTTCQAVALSPGYLLGEVVSVPAGSLGTIRLKIVGIGSPAPESLPVTGAVIGKVLDVPAVTGTVLQKVEASSGHTTYESSTLLPHNVPGSDVFPLATEMTHMTRELTRLGLTVHTPADLLEAIGRAGRIARLRLLLVTGEGAALILAFAAFAAASARPRMERVGDQLQTLGASRTQLAGTLAMDAVVPMLASLVIVVGGLFLAAASLPVGAVDRSAFISEALPVTTITAVVVVLFAGAAVLFVSSRRIPVRRRFGTLEAVAAVALGLVIWQSSASGGLNPGDLASGGTGLPVLLLTPGLTVFVAGVVLLRLLPVIFRLAERSSRAAGLSVRLAVLSIVRSPARAAVATTFLAVAVGTALFSLGYEATLNAQAASQARFFVGANARATVPTPNNTAITGLLAKDSAATPALRLPATTTEAGGLGGVGIELIGLPASRLSQVAGWRSDFSDVSRRRLARDLSFGAVALKGPTIVGSALRVYARDISTAERSLVVQLLAPGGAFQYLQLGPIVPKWRRLYIRLPADVQGDEVVGLSFPVIAGVSESPVVTPGAITGNATTSPDNVQVGGLSVHTRKGWKTVGSLQSFVAANSPGFQGIINPTTFSHGPIRSGVEFQLDATSVPVIRPPVSLQYSGGNDITRVIYTLPALAGPALMSQAVSGSVNINVDGTELILNIIGKASLFPTVTSDLTAFAVVDYKTLFAALNADAPGTASPNEAWFFTHPPKSVPPTVSLTRLAQQQAALARAPLAAGTADLLGATGIAAAVLAVLALLMFSDETVTRQRRVHAEYIAMGVDPRTVRRSVQLQMPLLCVSGLIAALLGGLLALRLTSALVSVTATSGRPLPPIVAVMNWTAVVPLLVGVGVIAIAGATAITARALRHGPAGGLRA